MAVDSFRTKRTYIFQIGGGREALVTNGAHVVLVVQMLSEISLALKGIIALCAPVMFIDHMLPELIRRLKILQVIALPTYIMTRRVGYVLGPS